MVKAIATSLVVVLLVSASAFGGTLGDLFNGFQHGVDLTGNGDWSIGIGGFDLDVVADVANDQSAWGVGTYANQDLVGAFDLGASGGGTAALIDVDLTVTSLGLDGGAVFGLPTAAGQFQDVTGNNGPVVEAEGLGVGSTQALLRDVGPGGADAANTLLVDQSQEAGNTSGGASESSLIAITQAANVGGTSGVGSAQNTVIAITGQLQVVN